MNQLDIQYQDLLLDILSNGTKKQTRNGEVISVFGKQIRHNMKDGFPLLTTKKMYWKGIVTELLWFLRGDTNIKYLVDHGVHIWTGDAYKKYSEHFIGYEDVPNKEWFIEQIKTDIKFANRWGELGPVYGKQWRRWKTIRKVTTNIPSNPTDSVDYIDQITDLINELKTNPDSRRLMVSAWNVGELDSMTLPPCHFSFQCYVRELNLDERAKLHPTPEMFYEINGTFSISDSIENSNFPDKDWLHEQFDKGGIPKRAISLMWNQRSVDVGLGLGFNIASYGLLLEIIAKEVNMIPEELIGNLGDTHLYLDHVEPIKTQLTREPYSLPKLTCKDEYWYLKDVDIPFIEKIERFQPDFFALEGYQSHPTIKLPLSN